MAVLLFVITPWTSFNARIGYETTFAFAFISIGLLLYEKPWRSFLLISLSTYAGHTQRYLAPMLIILIYFLFYFKKTNIKKVIMPLVVTALTQIPNLVLMFTPSFWVKNSSFTISFWSQYVSYFSPSNLFLRADFMPQRSIPEMAVFYSWMFMPWLVGFYEIYKNIKKPIYKYIIFLVLLMPIPSALANTNYSTQRALPLLLPYSLVIMLGVDKLVNNLKNKWWVVPGFGLICFSILMLFRSYFVLFPQEREQAWDYGYQSLSEYILKNPDKKFVVDNGRSVPYIELLFFMKYPPKIYQQENLVVNNKYYSNVNFDGKAKFANVEVRSINWKQDICIDQVLVVDNLSISIDQINEHFLTKVFEKFDSKNKILLQGYETNPKLKCQIETKVNR